MCAGCEWCACVCVCVVCTCLYCTQHASFCACACMISWLSEHALLLPAASNAGDTLTMVATFKEMKESGMSRCVCAVCGVCVCARVCGVCVWCLCIVFVVCVGGEEVQGDTKVVCKNKQHHTQTTPRTVPDFFSQTLFFAS